MQATACRNRVHQVALAVQPASVHAFHAGMLISAVLVAIGGLLGLAGIFNPRRAARSADCADGQIAGQPLDAGRERVPVAPHPQG